MAGLEEISPPSFEFSPLSQEFQAFASKEGKARFHRWGLEALQIKRFKFTGSRFDPLAEIDFVKDFITSTQFAQGIELSSNLSKEEANAVSIEKLPCTVLNMGHFDFLETKGLVAENGYLRKCMNDRVAGVDIDTLVTDFLLNEESEYVDIVDQNQKQEFISQLFHLIFVGGTMHQRDESITEYLESTKQLYKELLTVHKASATGKIEITSKVYKINPTSPNAEDGSNENSSSSSSSLFPGVPEHSRCFVVVDPMKKYATVIYSNFKSFW